MKEESKQNELGLKREKSFQQNDSNYLNARLSNNYQFQQAQHQVFDNISSFSKMVVYSLNANCQSIERSKYNQMNSLLNQFNKPKVEISKEDKKTFKQIIQNRFAGQTNEQQSESEESGSELFEEDMEMEEVEIEFPIGSFSEEEGWNENDDSEESDQYT